MTLRQRREPIRSRHYLDGSRGEDCKLRFPGCLNDRDTVVACHVHDRAAFGMGQKADDTSIIDGCFHCHSLLDQDRHGLSRTLLLEYLLRGIQETIASRALRKIYPVPDKAKPLAERATPPRKPKAERAKIQSRGFEPGHRPMQSRNNLRKAAT